MHWLEHFFGFDNLSGPWYGFWSGAGSDIGELTLIAAVIGLGRAHNCHVHKCWRIGRHPVDGTAYKVCRKHHPEGAPTHIDIIAAHQRHKARTEAVATTIKRLRKEQQGGPG